MRQPFFVKYDVLLPVLVAMLGLFGSLRAALVAPPDATRVAVLMPPWTQGPWAAMDRSGLPVVQVMCDGMLVVVDGAQAPVGMARLRQASLVLLDAARVPGGAARDDRKQESLVDDPND